jgi:phosphohistidine swiveling domain-containing protein
VGTTTFAAPGPGTWELDAAHFPATVSRIARDVMETAVHVGLGEGFSLLGAPLSTMDVAFVNGRMYRRLVPLIGGDRSGTPPNAVLWLATRLHPTFRKRARTADRSLRDRVWLAELRRWEDEWKPALITENLRLGAIDETSLDDDALAAHLEALVTHLETSTALHFRLHTSDLGPIGVMLVRAREWGLDDAALMGVLAGASPSTSAPAVLLGALRAELAAAGVDLVARPPTSLDEIRAAGPAASLLLDQYLALYGSRLTTGYDISDLTLAELPEVIITSVRDGRSDGSVGVDAAAASRGAAAFDEIRSNLPSGLVDEFDTVVGDARLLYGLRDENGPLTYQWPAGLVRRTVLETARRLSSVRAIDREDHVFDLSAAELAGLLRGDRRPAATEVAARCRERHAWLALQPPPFLGDPPSDPPIDVLPAAMGTMMRVTLAVTGLLEAVDHEDRLSGTGIGAATYTGTARVVLDADDALEHVEPGDVIVARLTVPTFNSVLSIAGAVVTEQGGLLCHTAVIARELGIPAVVGVADALVAIPDGATVTVDPVGGTVSIARS